MKYLSFPVHLLKFWYPESLLVFARTLKNLILYLEEDLAVGLMFRLLFVPLFHDSSFVGRILSFLFRALRILLGLFAFVVSSLFILIITLGWFLMPVLGFVLSYPWNIVAWGIVFSGMVLFANHILSHPHKKIWQIKKPADIWQASFVKPKEANWAYLLKTYQVKNFLQYLELTPEQLADIIVNVSKDQVEQKVWDLGKKLRVPYLSYEHFFVAILSLIPGIDNTFLKLNVSLEDFNDALDFQKRKAENWKIIWIFDENFHTKHLRGINRGWLGVPTPALDSAIEDLTTRASREHIPDFVGRQDVVSRVINILSLEQGRNVLIVGEPGSGRGALVLYLAKLIIAGDAPASFATKRLVRLDETKLLAGITSQGELAEKIKNIFEEVKFSGNIVVYVDEIQNLGLGEAGSEYNLYSLMLPFLESSSFQFIGVTDNASYIKVLEKDKSFAGLFAKVELPPATVAETVDILINQAIEFERYKKVKTTISAIKKIAQLTAEYIHESVLPDAALKVFDECLASGENGWVKQGVVEKVVQQTSHIPVGEVGENGKQELLNLEDLIHQKIIDQVEAVGDVAKTLRRAATELRDKKRPIGSFLFIGPTGVGKTELAKTLVEVYFKGKGNFARFDMSEYQNSESVERLIGKSGEEGQLTEIVRENPYSLILLDEFEKADPKILTLFLQVLDDGRLTSGSGKTVDFTNAIIIATSNAASLTIAQGLQNGKDMNQLKKEVNSELLTIFRPELVNRFDGVVLFKPLSQEDLKKIVVLKLAELKKQLEEKGYLIEFNDEVIKNLSEKGFDPVLGARPLRRLIQDTIESKLSVLILQGKLPKGEKTSFDFNS